MNERHWIDEAIAGNQAAVANLFQSYWRAARAAAFGVTGEWASAEDAASEGLFLALQSIRSLKDPERFGSWLRTIVIRKAQSIVANRMRFAELPLEAAADGEHPDDAQVKRQLAVAIQYAAQRLPAHLREANALVYFEGYEPEEAARFLEIPPGTLRRRLHEGREQIRDLVNEKPKERRMEHERIEKLMMEGDILHATRELLALRPPPPRDLVERLFPKTPQTIELIRKVIEPPPCTHPAWEHIRKALPEFQDWKIDIAAAFRTPASALPPGPGAWIRASRGLASADGSSVFELLQQRGSSLEGLHLVDVLELVWTTEAPMELRMVQELLERLAAETVPTKRPLHFASYSESRYRSALQASFNGRAAIGGVLLNFPQSAHVRMFLDEWWKS